MKSAIAFRMVAEAVVGISCAIFRTGTKSFVVGAFDQRRSTGVSRGRGDIVGMLSAADNKKTGDKDKGQSNTREPHSVLTIGSRANHDWLRVRIDKRSSSKNVVAERSFAYPEYFYLCSLGMRTTNSVLPGSELNRITPPYSSTMRCTMPRPIPVPTPTGLVV